MSGETAMTGKDGYLSVEGTPVARITNWKQSRKLAHTSEWGDSDGEGWTNRLGGRKDSTFTADGKFDTSSEFYDLFDIGDIVEAKLVMKLGLFWSYDRALCQSYDLAIDVDREEVVGWTSAWGGDGEVKRPGY